jgi:hypothetical protein
MAGRTRRIIAGVVTSAAVLVGTVAVAAPAGAADGPADLVVTASAPATALPSVPYSHTYTVTNQGGAVAPGTNLNIHVAGRDVGPGSSALLTSPPGCTQTAPGIFGDVTLVCPLGDLAPGATMTRQITVAAAGQGVYNHYASAYTPSPESNLDNNRVDSAVLVTSGAPGLDAILGQVLILLAPLLAVLHL